MTLEQIIEQALRTSLERRAQSLGGTVALIEPGNPAAGRGIFWLSNVAADIAAAIAVRTATKTAKDKPT